MLDWSTCPAVERDPERLSGGWVFRGTRVPVLALFDYLEGGQTLDEFLDDFPTVSKEAAIAALELAKHFEKVIATDRNPVTAYQTISQVLSEKK